MYNLTSSGSLLYYHRRNPRIFFGILIALLITLGLVVIRFKNSSTLTVDDKTTEWTVGFVADPDTESKVVSEDSTYWRSFFRKGLLTRDPESGMYSFNWGSSPKIELKTVLNEGGRGMELSTLIKYQNKLLSCDDRSGIVYSIVFDNTGEKATAIPQHILMDGNGESSKGFKCEWATVKDNLLHIGSFGKEWTNKNGEVINGNPMWVKTIDQDWSLRHLNWGPVFSLLRKATDTEHPGYMFHESCNWNPVLKRWFFLPRRVSKTMYDPKEDEMKGGNLMVSLNENFKDPNVFTVGTNEFPVRGFSCFKFIPGRNGEIVATKSEEVGTDTATYLTVFTVEGKILMPEVLIEKGLKYEGLEFV